eukprot:m.177824 g.177824  ORF g.177824 m.177824 type:complete len:369 (+) comp14916_c2_seq1:2701-3807(+)
MNFLNSASIPPVIDSPSFDFGFLKVISMSLRGRRSPNELGGGAGRRMRSRVRRGFISSSSSSFVHGSPSISFPLSRRSSMSRLTPLDSASPPGVTLVTMALPEITSRERPSFPPSSRSSRALTIELSPSPAATAAAAASIRRAAATARSHPDGEGPDRRGKRGDGDLGHSTRPRLDPTLGVIAVIASAPRAKQRDVERVGRGADPWWEGEGGEPRGEGPLAWVVRQRAGPVLTPCARGHLGERRGTRRARQTNGVGCPGAGRLEEGSPGGADAAGGAGTPVAVGPERARPTAVGGGGSGSVRALHSGVARRVGAGPGVDAARAVLTEGVPTRAAALPALWRGWRAGIRTPAVVDVAEVLVRHDAVARV